MSHSSLNQKASTEASGIQRKYKKRSDFFKDELKPKPAATRLARNSAKIENKTAAGSGKVQHDVAKLIHMADKSMEESADAMFRFEINARTADASQETYTSLIESLPHMDKLLSRKGKPMKKDDISARTQEGAMAALLAGFAKTIEANRHRDSENFHTSVEKLANVVKGYGGEAKSHGYIKHAFSYVPLPNADKLSGGMAHITATGLALINAAEANALDPMTSAMVNLAVRGKRAYHLQGKVEHQASLDWLTHADAVQIVEPPPDFGHTCLFVSASGGCDAARHAHMTRLVEDAHGDDAPLKAFLSVVSLPLHGSHKRNEEDPMHARTHLCYDVIEAWMWLVDQGMILPEGGLVALAHGTVGEIKAAFPKVLQNPARFSKNVCEGRLKMGFDATQEPSDLPWHDVETLIRAIVATLYLEVLQDLASHSFADCGQAMQGVKTSWETMSGADARFRAVSKKLALGKTASKSRRLALVLYYLYGPGKACSSLDSLYPHGTELRNMLRDLSAVREKLAPRAAQQHYRNEFLTLAQSAKTHIGRTLVGHVVHKIKRGAGVAVRAVQDAAAAFADVERYLLILKPVFCCLGMVGYFYSGDARVRALINANGFSTMTLHVLFGEATGLAFSRLYDVFGIMNSIKSGYWVQGLYLSQVITNYFINFFQTFLPYSKELWIRAGEAYKNGLQLGLAESFFKKSEAFAGWFGPFGAIFGATSSLASSTAGNFKDYRKTEATVLGVAAMALMPLEAFASLGARIGACIQYVSPGGMFGGLRKEAPFLLGLLEMLVMMATGNYLYVTLRLLEFACIEFHKAKTMAEVKSVCEERAKKYHSTLMLIRTFSRLFAFLASGGVTGMVELLQMIMGEGVRGSFENVCVGKLPMHNFEKLHTEAKEALGVGTEKFPDLGEADRELMQKFNAAHNAHINAVQQKYAWRDFIKARHGLISHSTSDEHPPGVEVLQSYSTQMLQMAERKMADAQDWYHQAITSLGLTSLGIGGDADAAAHFKSHQKLWETEKTRYAQPDLDKAQGHIRPDLSHKVWEAHHARITKNNLLRDAAKATASAATGGLSDTVADAANAASNAASNTASNAAAKFANVTATAYENVKRTTTPEYLKAESSAMSEKIRENIKARVDESYLLNGLDRVGSFLR